MRSSSSIDDRALTSEGAVLDLDDPRCRWPHQVGPKAAWLARARSLGLPALAGLVVTAPQSAPAIELGTMAMAARGSGGARLAVMEAGLPAELRAELWERATRLGSVLAVRSSALLEGQGQWAGAFSSFVGIAPADLETAVAGCWASMFNPSTLARLQQTDLAVAEARMAVLIQPALTPDFGGVARLGQDGSIHVIGIAGGPQRLVAGWETGCAALVNGSDEVDGDDAIALMGSDLICAVAATLRRAHDELGATRSEWAVQGGRVHLLQLDDYGAGAGKDMHVAGELMRHPLALDLARLSHRYPGPAGERLVLAWAMGNPTNPLLATAEVSATQLENAAGQGPVERLAAELTAQVWDLPKDVASVRAQAVFAELRGRSPESAFASLRQLARPDRGKAQQLLHMLAAASRLPAASNSNGLQAWMPFQIGAMRSFGEAHRGIAVGSGIRVGRLCRVLDPATVGGFRPGDVILTSYPVPDLASLLWAAAGLVTTRGGPAAHLFDAARSLRVPAVCGVASLENIEMGSPLLAAIDGDVGVVHLISA